jgi:hypothetical protein
MRFYPPELPSFTNEPTRDRFAIRRLNDQVGEGVVSLADLAEGDIVFAFTGLVVAAPTMYSLRMSPEVHIHDPYFMGKVLHHCDPNCTVDMAARVFIARRPIKIGDPITMDYAQTEDRLHRAFDCHCGAEHCRGRIGD